MRQDAQVLALLEDVHRAFFIIRRGHHLQIELVHHLGRGLVHRPVQHRRAAEGRDQVGHEGPVIGRGDVIGLGRPRGCCAS
jgi:hypothetical protein